MSGRKLHPSQSILKRIKGSGTDSGRNKTTSFSNRPVSAYLDTSDNVLTSKESLKKESDVISTLGATLWKKLHFTSSQNDIREESRPSKSGGGTPTITKHPSPPSLSLHGAKTSSDSLSIDDNRPPFATATFPGNPPLTLIQGFHSSSSGSENEDEPRREQSPSPSEENDSFARIYGNIPENNPRENIRALAAIFSSLESVLQRAIRTACLLDFLFTYDRDAGPFLFKLLLDDYRDASSQNVSSKDVLHKATQLYAIFLHPKAPLRLPVNHNDGFHELITQVSPCNMQERWKQLDCAVQPLIQNDLNYLNDKVITQGIYANIIPDAVLSGVNSKDEDLREFDRKLSLHYTTFHEKSTVPGPVGVQSQAKVWCLEEIGRYMSEKVTRLAYNEKDILQSSNSLRPFLSPRMMSRSSENLTANYFWISGSSSNIRKDISPKQITRRSTILGKAKKMAQMQVQVRNHSFTPQSLDKLAECGVCNEIFWGHEADKCPTCQLCAMRVHSRCQTDNLKKCTRKMTSESQLPRTYSDSNQSADQSSSTDEGPSSAPFLTNDASSRSRMDTIDKNGRTDNAYFNSDNVLPATPMSPNRSTSIKESNSESRLPVDTAATLSRKSIEVASQLQNDDISRYFPKEDEFFSVEESYDGVLTKKLFPQSDKLSDSDMKRVHILAEYHYYIRYTIKQLKILDLFCNKLWKDQVKHDNMKHLYDNLGFSNVAPLVDLYMEQEKIIRRAMTPMTYKHFGNHILDWLRKHEIPLFRYTNSLCGCVRNASVWQELEKPQPNNQEVYKLLNEIHCQRFSMKHKVQNIYVVMVIRLPFVMNHTREGLRKMNLISECESWEKIHSWYHRIPKYQNNRLQPLLTVISESRFLNGMTSTERNFESLTPFLMQFPKQIFDDFLFAWQPVKVLSVTSAMSSTSPTLRKESSVSRSSLNSNGGNAGSGANAGGAQGSEINTDLSRSNESHQALLLLYQSRLVILQRSEGNERFILKCFKTKRTEQGSTSISILPGRANLVTTQQHMIPVFNLDEIYCSLTTNVMYLIIVNKHDNYFLQLEFTTKEDGERWKEMLQHRGKQPHADSGTGVKSGTLNMASTKKGMSRFSVRSFRATTPDPRELYQQLFESLDLEAASGGPKESALKALLGSSFNSFLEQQQQTRPLTSTTSTPSATQHSSTQHELNILPSTSQSLPQLRSSDEETPPATRKIAFEETPDAVDTASDQVEQDQEDSLTLHETEVILSDEESDHTLSPDDSPTSPASPLPPPPESLPSLTPSQEQLWTNISCAKRASETLIESIDIRFQELDSSATEIVHKIKETSEPSSTSCSKPNVEELLLCCMDRLAMSNVVLVALLADKYFPRKSIEPPTCDIAALEQNANDLQILVKEIKTIFLSEEGSNSSPTTSTSQNVFVSEDGASSTVASEEISPSANELLRLAAQRLVNEVICSAKEQFSCRLQTSDVHIPHELAPHSLEVDMA